MNKYNDSPALLDGLRSNPVGVSSPEELEAEREHLLPWLEEEVKALPRRRRARVARRTRAIVGAAVGLAAGFSLALWQPWDASNDGESVTTKTSAPSAHATLLSGEVVAEQLDILPGSKLGLSSHVKTSPRNGAHLRVQGGYELKLAPNTELSSLGSASLDSSDAVQLRLARGGVRLSVPELEEKKSLSVVTDDARAVVVGTEFRVVVLERGERKQTCVEVFEGRVDVTRNGGTFRRLVEDESWGCELDEEADDTPKGESGRDDRAASNRAKSNGPRTALAAQNALLASALAAERRGDTSEARKHFRQLIHQFPNSPFLPEAKEGLRRLKSTKKE